MYGLPQAGRIAYDKLLLYLAEGGYVPTGRTQDLFQHKARKITFCLIIDDFGIKYEDIANANHLLSHLGKEFTATIDRARKTCCRVDLMWDYTNRTVELSIPDYFPKHLIRINHLSPKKHPSHLYIQPIYGSCS